MKIALSVMNQVWENKQANLNACIELAERASKHQADILIFPEMTLTGFTLNTPSIAEESESSASLHSFADMATTYNMGIIAGLVLRTSGLLQNCAVAFGKNGEPLCRYAKIHPFSLSGESRYISGGSELSTFEYEGLRFGLTICYDLRFPVLWYVLADKCDCIINIANWPAKRVDHWRTLLQARAIENQVYVIGVNRIGLDGNQLEYIESSYAFAPDGSIVNPVVIDEGLSIIEIEKIAVKKCQDAFPVRNDRCRTLYRNFLNAEAES
ncbi:MAG: nitrilase-related carbon-nitrogen hydrolase [Gallionella sp.]|nr:nitrilase-related carbon-nitrogen hydrolase [Gallionella sp.]